VAQRPLAHDDRFPVGQTVQVYLAAPYGDLPPSGVPGGTLITSAVVAANGNVTFTGLLDNTSYYAYAQVSGVNIYVRFRTTPSATGGGGGSTVTSSQQAGDYTLTLADAGTCIEGTKATSQTFTVPPNSSVAFPLGTVIEAFQAGAGTIILAPGAGVTFRSDGGKVNTAAQYATVGLRQRSTDEWVLSGDLA